jgi:glycosyltransferase involved in cell wall biosynthesis
MRIAFYAPLKAPNHPVASGDRTMARSFVQALSHAGHEVSLASRLRTFDAKGDPARQVRLRHLGQKIAARFVVRARADAVPDLWFTYHVHHKAPDHLGPLVSRLLGIPYVVAEASVAPRWRTGPWAEGYADALAAICAADTVIAVNPRDVAEVRKARGTGAPCELLAPFLDVDAFAGPQATADRTTDAAEVRLVTVAMMREGAKLASYRVLATALAALRHLPWKLSIVGDGPLRESVEEWFAPVAARVRFVGARQREDIAGLFTASDLFVWPAVDEAFGMSFLEAQACGLPVVGADTPGVGFVVDAGSTGLLCPMGDAPAFAAAMGTLIADTALRTRMGRAAFRHVRERHDLPAAAVRLDAILRAAVERRAGATPAEPRARRHAPTRAPR